MASLRLAMTELFGRGLRRLPDEFSLIDAVSLEVMRRSKLTHAFAFDRHFTIAGFALLAQR